MGGPDCAAHRRSAGRSRSRSVRSDERRADRRESGTCQERNVGFSRSTEVEPFTLPPDGRVPACHVTGSPKSHKRCVDNALSHNPARACHSLYVTGDHERDRFGTSPDSGGTVRSNVVFRSAKERPFAERKATNCATTHRTAMLKRVNSEPQGCSASMFGAFPIVADGLREPLDFAAHLGQGSAGLCRFAEDDTDMRHLFSRVDRPAEHRH